MGKGDKSFKKTHEVLVESLDEMVEHCNGWMDDLKNDQAEFKGSDGEDLTRPYFFFFNIHDEQLLDIVAADGAISDSAGVVTNRYARVEVRLGNYKNDSMGSATIGITEDKVPLVSKKRFKRALKKSLWEISKGALESAIDNFGEKKSSSIREHREEDPPPDFSRVECVDEIHEPKMLKRGLQTLEKRLRNLSQLLSEADYVKDSHIELKIKTFSDYIFTTEGTRIVQQNTYVGLVMQVSAEGLESKETDQGKQGMVKDGTTVTHWNEYYFRDIASIPNDKKLKKDAKKLLSELDALRKAEKITKSIVVPVITDQDSSNTFLHEALESHRTAPLREGTKKTKHLLKDMLDEQVLPRFIDAYSDPTLVSYKGKKLNGYYLFDNEGVKAQRVQLIKRGNLINLLLSRSPIKDSGRIFERSNGHGRLEYTFIDEDTNAPVTPEARKSTFILQSRKEMKYSDLLKRLEREIKRQKLEFGLLVEKASNGNSYMRGDAYLKIEPRMLYKYYAGRRKKKKVLTRGLYTVGTPLISLGNNIIATGNNYKVINGRCNADSGTIFESSIVPRLLLEKVEFFPNDKTSASDHIPKP